MDYGDFSMKGKLVNLSVFDSPKPLQAADVMAVYVDEAIWQWAGQRWCHLLADDVDELHRFAARLGVHRLVLPGAAEDLRAAL